jgi:TonB family protein
MRAARVLAGTIALLASLTVEAADENELELSSPRTLPSGFWQYRVMRGAELTNCGMQSERPTYAWHTVHLENVSNDTITCKVQLTCTGRQCFPTTTLSANAVVSPKQQATVIRACIQPNDTYEIQADCQRRAPRAPLKIPPNCRYDLIRTVSLDEFYPPLSQRLRDRGPVDVAFTLPTAEGVPSDPEVVGSSLSPRLDEAALKAARTLRLRTNCPGTRFEMHLNFELDADGRGTVSLAR